ncbi:MAG: FAD-binding protein [Caldilineales bacterium]
MQPQDSNTYWAQGGIIYRGEHDSPDALAEDILRAGAGHSYPKAVHILAEEGPQTLRRILLERVDVGFDRESDGDLSLALEGGHSIPRIVHVADYTGKAIELALVRALAAHPNVTLLTGHGGRSADAVAPFAQPAGGVRTALLHRRASFRSGQRAGQALPGARDHPGNRRAGADLPAHHQPGRRAVAMAWPWPSVSRRASSTWSSSSFTPPRSTTSTRPTC